jgi:hypothetical protein
MQQRHSYLSSCFWYHSTHHCLPSFSVTTLDLESQKLAQTMMVGSAAPYLDEVEMSLNIYLEHIHTHCFDSFNHTSKLSNDFLLETSNTLKMVRREREKERELQAVRAAGCSF